VKWKVQRLAQLNRYQKWAVDIPLPVIGFC